MSYPATKQFTYWGQFGVLMGLTGAGIVLAGIVSFIPLWMNPELGTSLIGASQEKIMDKLLVPENAGMLRLVQLLSTLFIFFLPTLFYAWICHKKSGTHLGFNKPVNGQQMFIVLLIMFACLPLVGMLAQFTESLPFSEANKLKFKIAEEDYARQIEVVGRMNNFKDYLLALFMLAIFPALFEETLFRGGIQNLLSRWFKAPVLAIIVTSIIFSAIHFSYIGFLSRVALSLVLGWMYYRTGNLWLSIIGHITNNGVAMTVLYLMKLNNPALKVNDADPTFPIWVGIFSTIVLVGLLLQFEKINMHQNNNPGEEELMVVEDARNPSWAQETPNNQTNNGN